MLNGDAPGGMGTSYRDIPLARSRSPSKGEYFHSGAAAAGDMNASPCPGISPIPEESQLFNCFPNENSLPKWVRLHKRNHKLFKPKLRAPKCLQSLFEGRAVGWGFRTA